MGSMGRRRRPMMTPGRPRPGLPATSSCSVSPCSTTPAARRAPGLRPHRAPAFPRSRAARGRAMGRWAPSAAYFVGLPGGLARSPGQPEDPSCPRGLAIWGGRPVPGYCYVPDVSGESPQGVPPGGGNVRIRLTGPMSCVPCPASRAALGRSGSGGGTSPGSPTAGPAALVGPQRRRDGPRRSGSKRATVRRVAKVRRPAKVRGPDKLGGVAGLGGGLHRRPRASDEPDRRAERLGSAGALATRWDPSPRIGGER